MYQASNAFHQAVANGNHQIALLIFPDALFSSSDIDVDAGIEFNDYFNMEEDISIGQCLSNEISFCLFNDRRLLNDYGFGEFTATIGVQVGAEAAAFTGNCMIQDGADMYVGRDTSPYLRKNGSAMANAPAWPVKGLLSLDGKLFAFGANNNVKVYDEATGNVLDEPVNAFMLDKAKRDIFGKGVRYDGGERELGIWKNGQKYTYEFVPLGVFTADRPNVPDVIRIDMRCNDRMTELDKDWPGSAAMGISYPTTVGTLFEKICTYYNIPYRTSTFINSTATVGREPDEFESTTSRTVLKWIAEAAASNARIDRDGYMVLDWLKTTEQSYDENDYTDFGPYWYETQVVDKVYNRSTQDAGEKVKGTGEVGYLIQDNPLLKGVG